MAEPQKIEYSQLEAGYRFSPARYVLDPDTVALYMQAVEEDSPLYRGTGTVPPMAVAANAIAALSRDITLPGGAVHVSEELEFCEVARIDDTITCHSHISKKQVRGKLHILTVDFEMSNQHGKVVATGKTSFILPQ